MRNIKIAPGEYYHIYNRGTEKRLIFSDQSDWFRFLFLVLYFQSSIQFENMNRVVKQFRQTLRNSEYENVVEKRRVELVSFCVMPNHFHLIVKEVEEGGIAGYLQRVLNSYTKYFNTKYERSGHLFQGPYKAVHVEDDNHLMYLSSYIHKNPRELPGWLDRETKYPWSSYQDYVGKNRWGRLLEPGIIMERYQEPMKYRKFVETSTAKLLLDELEPIDEIVQHSVLNT